MKAILSLLLFFTFFKVQAADKSPIGGAWQSKDAAGNTITMICSDNYLMFAVYDLAQQKYVRSGGGSYQLSDIAGKKVISYKRDFNTEDSSVVGLTVANVYTLNDKDLVLTDGDTHQFFGSGGGTYTVKDGKYTETIEFFSRDNKRVGASLTFDCVLNGKDWTHAGQSTTGTRVHEIWEREE
ncbi:MAG: hypothetical protein MUF58_21650 [Arcicella sp.]|nr:hypothetical protein [Arcicella sp.]